MYDSFSKTQDLNSSFSVSQSTARRTGGSTVYCGWLEDIERELS